MVQVCGLDDAETAKIVELLQMSNQPFTSITKAFEAAFTPDRYGQVVSLLRALLELPFGASESIETVPQTVIAYHLIRLIQTQATQNSRRNPVANLARATQFHELQRLEALLRDDARIAESHKYKQSNPSNPNGGKKQSAKEVGELDVGRCRLLLKATLFRHLLGRMDAESVTELLNTSRASLEAEAETWSTQSALKQSLIEAVSELKAAAEAEANLSMGGAAARTATCMACPSDSSLFPETVSAKPVWVRPRPTTLPTTASELRFITAPSANQSLLLDATPYTAEWRTATKLLADGRAAALSATEQQQLVSASNKCAGHFNLTIPAFLELSERNPQTAAQIVHTIPQQELFIDALLAIPNSAGCLRSEILLAATIQPHQLTLYVKSMVTQARGTTNKQLQAEIVSTLAVTLHQLTKKQPLAKSDSDLVASLFNDFAQTVPDVPALWGSLLKSS